MRQQHAAVVLVLLLLLAAAAMPPLASARLLVLSNTTLTHFAEITALFGLPKEQLSLGVSDKDFLAVLGKALEATDMLVQQQADKRDDDALYQLAMDIASKTLDGPRDFVLQGLGNTFVLKLPASFPTVTYPMINITNFPTMPWLNKTVTIKGFPTFSFLNWSMGLDLPRIPLLDSKVILSNKFKEATFELYNASNKA